MQLLKLLPRFNFTTKQKELLVSQIVDNLEVFGRASTIAQNMSYFVHCIETIPEYFTDWRLYNQVMLCFQKLALGNEVVINREKLNTLDTKNESNSEPRATSDALKPSIFSNFTIKSIRDGTDTDPFQLRWSKHASMSISSFHASHLDYISSKVQKAETIIRKRNNLFKSKSIII